MALVLSALSLSVPLAIGAHQANPPIHRDEQAFATVGKDGTITMQGGTTSEHELNMVDGMKFDKDASRRAPGVETVRLELFEMPQQKHMKQSVQLAMEGPFDKGESSADLEGAHANAVGDLAVFLTGLVTNSLIVAGIVVAFSVVRRRNPIVYAGNTLLGKVPFEPSNDFFGWVSASLSLQIEDIIECAGLDQALLIEFTDLAFKLLCVIAVPLLLVMGPLHWSFGGDRSGDDHLSKLGFANIVDNHPWLYWVHSLLVWVVVVTVERHIYSAQATFIRFRVAWLEKLPAPRATTVLVQNIPPDHCTDAKVTAYFNSVFHREVVECSYVVKHTEVLQQLLSEKESHDRMVHEGNFKAKKTGDRPTFMDYRGATVDLIEFYTNQSKASAKSVKDEKTRIANAIKHSDPSVFTHAAFVTFKSRRDTEIALKIMYTSDDDVFVCERPPDASDVIYSDFQKDRVYQSSMAAIGYALIAGVFWCYMPAVLSISYITDLTRLADRFPMLRFVANSQNTVAMWNAMMGSLVLQLLMSLAPKLLVKIFSFSFLIKARAWLQLRVQIWYFWFLVVYVMLTTAVGSSLIESLDEVAQHPAVIFYLLASTMPYATHFYLNFVPLNWVSHAQALLRPVQFFKFEAFKALYGEELGKELSEPEDQDYYGIGSRCARHSFFLALVLVYCQLTPLIIALGIVNFVVIRVVYGYLITYAEVRKPDLGGVFWVTDLRNIQRCMPIYIVLMSGVLLARDATKWPCLIAGSSFLYWYRSYSRFPSTFRWESLCMENLVSNRAEYRGRKAHTAGEAYAQKELMK